MAKSYRLRSADHRAIFRLVGECRELGDDPGQWRDHLLGWVARTGGCPVVNEYEAALEPKLAISGITGHGWDNSGLELPYWVAVNAVFEQRGFEYAPMFRPYFDATARGMGPCLSRPDLVADRDWYGTEYYQLYHGPSKADVMMYCILPQPNGRISGVVLVRPARDPDFSGRTKTIIGAAHAMIAPLIGGPLAGYAEPAPTELSPRIRQVLKCILEGDSDKLIGARLGMARNTVNHHVKRIYRHFRVRSRTELMARWLSRGWGNRCAWADDLPER